ncbi:MAG: phosphatidylserine decarboxylase family protein [Bacteroidetes bacterium SW_10_40_5]|nr:MAG: phosphatidylserine decarboxylase family protein [Bacteroidetes bacterium SW_10_40_5]
MGIHPEGYSILAFLFFFVLLPLNLAVLLWAPFFVSYPLMIVSFLLMLFVLQFFRNPQRKPPEGYELLVSPADGKVVVIEQVFEQEYFGQERLQVSIFMSPTDVHLNRVPMTGKLVYYQYHPGQYLAAYNPKSSELNEQNTIVIEGEKLGKIILRQIAGVVARRIQFYHNQGAQLTKGEELGFIRFGSRMDVLLPKNFNLNVQLGDQVYGGESIIAQKV